MKDESTPKTETLSIRVKPEEKARLDELAKILSEQLGAEVTRSQAFSVALKEALQKRAAITTA